MRTDEIIQQFIMCYNESKKGVKDYAKLARDVKNYLLDTSEKLSRRANDEGELKICDIAESVCDFYDILPSDTFKVKPSTFAFKDDSDSEEEKKKPVKVAKKQKK